MKPQRAQWVKGEERHRVTSMLRVYGVCSAIGGQGRFGRDGHAGQLMGGNIEVRCSSHLPGTQTVYGWNVLTMNEAGEDCDWSC